MSGLFGGKPKVTPPKPLPDEDSPDARENARRKAQMWRKGLTRSKATDLSGGSIAADSFSDDKVG